jgi:urease accessory protein
MVVTAINIHTEAVMPMTISMHDDLSLVRLFQLVSPTLPIGAYSYSQGIEWAVEAGWISDENDLEQWLAGLLETNMVYLELPLLKRMIEAWDTLDKNALEHWNEYLLASRETLELRLEETNRARAFYRVLSSLDVQACEYKPILVMTQIACYSYACQSWNIGSHQAAYGLSWSWLENLVLCAVKIIPLGQTAGQQILFKLSAMIPAVIAQADDIADDDIGASSMALAIASAQHETQYTRLFRS